MKTFEELEFHNTFNELGMSFATAWLPARSPDPRLLACNEDAARRIELDPEEFRRPDAPEILCGNKIFKEYKPLVQIYAGHVYGEFVQRLGDGRCILLGEVVTGKDERWDLQLKGAGKTPLSRDRDGRCGLSEAVREYLVGEALHALGIPTTRFLSIVGVAEEVEREGGREGAAVVVRLAPCHVRFGHFEYYSRLLQQGWVRNLTNHVIRTAFPEIELDDDRYRLFLRGVVERTAELVAGWQAEGFCHGQMNTDDMSAVGVSLDLATGGFMERYDPAFDPNPADTERRYAFARQPDVALWNLARLGECILDFVSTDVAMGELERYRDCYRAAYRRRMQAKLGLEAVGEDDLDGLLDALPPALHASGVDYPRFLRSLADLPSGPDATDDRVLALARDPAPLEPWLARYRSLLAAEGSPDEERRERLRSRNPARVLRAALLEETLRKVRDGDTAEIDRVRSYLARPFDD